MRHRNGTGRTASRRCAAAAAALSCLLLLGGCDGGLSLGDPYDRSGTWRPTGDNDANLRAMVADPNDLVAGKKLPDTLGAEAAPPVGLLLSGKRLPLPSPGDMTPGAASSGPSQGGGSAGTQ